MSFNRKRSGVTRRVDKRRGLLGLVVLLASLTGLIGTVAIGAGTAGANVRPSSAAYPGGATCPTVKYPVTNFLEYVCGTSGKANPKLSPVYVGYVNEQNGPADVDDSATTAVEATVKLVNDQLGGIDGHKLVLDTCFIPETVAAAAQCGQEFADNPKIQSVIVGTILIVGNEAFEDALAPTHKLLIMFSGGPTDEAYKNALWLYGSATSLEGPFATFMKTELHAKSVATLYPTTPGEVTGVDALIAGLKLEHIKYTVDGYDPSVTDMTLPLEAADASKASVIFSDASFTGCSDLYLALKQLHINKPVVVNPLCIGPSIAQADGGSLPRWYYGIGSPLDSDTSDPSGAAYNRFAKKYGVAAGETDNWDTVTFAQMLTDVRFMNELGVKNLNAANLNHVAKSFKGPMVWGPPKLVCGDYPAAKQVCLDEIQVFRPTASGVFKNIAGWISPPPGEAINAG